MSFIESYQKLLKKVNFSGKIKNFSRINRVTFSFKNGINLLVRRLGNSVLMFVG